MILQVLELRSISSVGFIREVVNVNVLAGLYPKWPEPLAKNIFQVWQEQEGLLFLHIGSAASSFLICPFQISPTVRRQFSRFHPYIGAFFVLDLTVAMLSAIPLVFHARNCTACGGTSFALGFFTMAAAPAIFCWIATYYIAIQGNLKLHGIFMILCYGSLFGGFALFRLSLLFAPTADEYFRTFMIAVTPLSWMIGAFIAFTLSTCQSKRVKIS